MRLQFWIKTTIGLIFCTPSHKTLSIVKIWPPWLVKIHPLARCRWAVNCSLGCPMNQACGITGWERPYWCAVCWGAHGRKTCPLHKIRPSDLFLWSGSMLPHDMHLAVIRAAHFFLSARGIAPAEFLQCKTLGTTLNFFWGPDVSWQNKTEVWWLEWNDYHLACSELVLIQNMAEQKT